MNNIYKCYESIFINNLKKWKISKKNQSKDSENKIKYIYFNLVALLLFITSYYFYYLSLEKCIEGDYICSTKWNWIILKVKQFIISAIIIILLMILIINKIISRLHIFHFIAIMIYFYNYSHSWFFIDHGGLNIIGLFGAIIISILLLFIIKFFFYIIKIKFKYKIIPIIVLLFMYNYIINPFYCDDWEKGLNNTSIENDINKYGCRIRFPQRCEYKILEFTQDFSKIFFKSCSNKEKNARNNILKHSESPFVNMYTMKFGFPLTNNEEGMKDGYLNTVLKNYTFKNLVDMDKDIPANLPKPEYIVDFSRDPLGELIINLNFNESLSKERKNIENNSVPYSDNILILYIDSVSRATSIRKLKKTLNFFEKFIPYKGNHQKNYKSENYHSFQFFKYHAHEGYTARNFPILFFGNTQDAKDFVRITKYLKENGYITSYITDICVKENSRLGRDLSKDSLTDHQLLLCDPNAPDINMMTKRCLYGNINTYYLLEYINQFWRKYKNNRKFAILISNDGHEGTLELIKYTDDIIYNFLISLFNDNLLKNTTVFLLSDHGCTNPSIYFLNEFYQIEHRLPMLYIIINDRKNLDYNQQYYNIHKNQQTFITGYDIYNTIANII